MRRTTTGTCIFVRVAVLTESLTKKKQEACACSSRHAHREPAGVPVGALLVRRISTPLVQMRLWLSP